MWPWRKDWGVESLMNAGTGHAGPQLPVWELGLKRISKACGNIDIG